MKKIKIFMNGKHQIVELPKEYQFNCNTVYIKKLDNLIVLIPENSVYSSFLMSLNEFSEDFMSERDQPSL